MRRLDLTPEELDMPAKFDSFRLVQQDFVARCNDWPGRVVAAQIPTGGGKSLAYIAASVFAGQRAVVLTSSKGLQDQLLTDFRPCGLVDARGRNNFTCTARKPRSCEWGMHTRCPHMRSPEKCEYLGQLTRARKSELVVTNYSYWMAIHQFGEGLGPVDTLVLDEAHDAPEEVCAAASVEMTGREVYTLLRTRPPSDDMAVDGWKWFAGKHHDKVRDTLRELKADMEGGRGTDHTVQEWIAWSGLDSKLQRLIECKGDWAVERGRDSWTCTPLWASQYTEELLLRGTKRVILVSATLQPKTLAIMGLSTKRADGTLWLEYPTSFPPKASPFYHVPTVKVSAHMDADDKALWLSTIDRLISTRTDRKGIIHAVSYERAKYILENSQYSWAMIDYSRGEVADTVREFKAAEAPAILVGPSTTTGYDFPGDECRYQIHCKVPFADPRSPLNKARQKSDRHYAFYVTALDVVQSDGRGTRGKDDWCENFMIDDQWLWFFAAARQFLPSHFRRRVQFLDKGQWPVAPAVAASNAQAQAKDRAPPAPQLVTRPEPTLDFSVFDDIPRVR